MSAIQIPEKVTHAWKRVRSRVHLPRGGSGYEYAATRIRASASRLFTDQDYDRFVKMSTSEILRVMEEGEYQQSVDELSTQFKGEELVERALDASLAATVSRLLSYLPEDSPLLEYARRWDVYNIKTAVRALGSDVSKEVVARDVLPLGTLGKEKMRSLLAADDRAGVLQALKGTRYETVLAEHADGPVEALEDALDRAYYAQALEHARGYAGLYQVLQAEIDVKNALVLFRLTQAGADNISDYFLDGGTLARVAWSELVKKTEHEQFKILEKYAFWTHVPGGTKELGKIEAGLRTYVMLSGQELLRDYSPTFSTLMGYMRAREREAANVRLIVRSKQAPDPEQEIQIRSQIYTRKR